MRRPLTVHSLMCNLSASLSAFRQLLLGLVLAGIFGCSTTPQMVEKDGAGKAIDTSLIPNATPKPEIVTKAGNKSPYEVFGKTYWVLPSNRGYKESGVASWYGTKFHGRLTSNGEIYNMYGMTAAHKSLPIPSYARVTNTENGRSIVVRINDRGPFHDERIIDLSYVGAMKLGYADKGTAKVIVEAIETTPTPDPKPITVTSSDTVPKTPTAKVATADTGEYIQVGAFTNRATAQQLKKKISHLVNQPISLRTQDKLHKLWIGPIADKVELLSIKALLKKSANLSTFSVTP